MSYYLLPGKKTLYSTYSTYTYRSGMGNAVN